MIFKDALRSLKHDLSKAVFYWLTFVIVTTFFFLFFNFSGAESSGLEFIDSNNLITGVIVLMLIICSIDIFFANNFYIKSKSKDIGVRLVCGATYTHIAFYLLIQTAILLLTSVPAAYLISLAVIPSFNKLLANTFHTDLHIKFTAGSMGLTALVIAYLVFWLVLLNLSFAYQNTAGTMMNSRNVTRNRGSGSVFHLSASGIVMKVIYTVLFLAPLAGFFFVPASTYFLLALIGIFGFNGFIKTVVYPFCSRISSDSGLKKPCSMVLAGFFSTDLMVNSMNILLYIVSVVLLGSLLITAKGKAIETVLVMVAYITACILQAMTVMFRSASEFSGRQKYYLSLDQIGFLEEDLKKITRNETFLYFGFVLAAALLYVGIMFINMVRYNILSAGITVVLLLFLIVPMIIFASAAWIYHRSCIYPLPRTR